MVDWIAELDDFLRLGERGFDEAVRAVTRIGEMRSSRGRLDPIAFFTGGAIELDRATVELDEHGVEGVLDDARVCTRSA